MPDDNVSALTRLRESHQERVLNALRDHGPLNRAQLAERTGLSRTTLSAIVQGLLGSEAVTQATVTAGDRTQGRPVSKVALNATGGLALGMDLGHRHITVTVANVAHEIIASESISCAERTPWHRRIDLAVDLVGELTVRHGVSLGSLAGVGVGVVGPVSQTAVSNAGGEQSGSSRSSGRATRNALVHDQLAARLGVPVFVDNNTRLAALAEAIWGSAAGVANVLYLRLSHGVGAGLIIDGHLFSGAGGAAGELGHISIDPEGPPCSCGGRGCLERYVSLTDVLREAGVRTIEDLLRKLEADDPVAHRVVEQAGQRIGRVLASTCNVVNPKIVIIGGELANCGQPLLAPLREAFALLAHRDVRKGLRIQPAGLGTDDAARGGIGLVLRRSALLAGYEQAGEPDSSSPTDEASANGGETPS